MSELSDWLGLRFQLCSRCRDYVPVSAEMVGLLVLQQQEACGLAFDHGRLLAEASELWQARHRANVTYDMAMDDRCCALLQIEPCPTNPYATADEKAAAVERNRAAKARLTSSRAGEIL